MIWWTFLQGNTPCDLTLTQYSKANFVAWKVNPHYFLRDCNLACVVFNLNVKFRKTYLDRPGTESHPKRFESRGLAAGRDLCIDSCHVSGKEGHCVALLVAPLQTIKMN